MQILICNFSEEKRTEVRALRQIRDLLKSVKVDEDEGSPLRNGANPSPPAPRPLGEGSLSKAKTG